MKNILYISCLLVALFSCKPAPEQSGKRFKAESDTLEFRESSKITMAAFSSFQIESLDALGKIWGLMKYYHPAVAEGDYNWDYELFRIMPKVLNATTKEQRDKIFVKWIKSFGRLPQAEKQLEKDSSNIKTDPDFKWIEDGTWMNKELSNLLQKLRHVQTDSVNYYVSLAPGIGNPRFEHENSYPEMSCPDAGYRLLALYRYWNTIQYFFPYRYLIGEDWNKTLSQFIPLFAEAQSSLEYKLAILKLITRVNDTHANIWQFKNTSDTLNGIYQLPVKVAFVENKAIITGIFTENFPVTGLRKGDIITKIKQKTIVQIIEERKLITPASNEPTRLRNIAFNLLRSNDTLLVIDFERQGKKRSVIVKNNTNYKLIVPSLYGNNKELPAFKLLRGNNIGYIYIGSLLKDSVPSVMNQLKDTKGVVLDLRCPPEDSPLYELGEYLVTKSTPFVTFTNGSIASPGKFSYTHTMEMGKRNSTAYRGKIVILVNEMTQSSAEFHAMAFRASPKAIVMGSTTAGADGNVSFFTLPGNIRTTISGIGIYYPDGRETQRVGIIPDIEVKPTIKGIQEGRDEVLEKAIEWINKKQL